MTSERSGFFRTERPVLQLALDTGSFLMQTPNLPARARQLTMLGVDFLCVHTAFDFQATGASPLAELAQLAGLPVAPLVVAGGIGPQHVPTLLAYQPAAMVVAGAVTRSEDPVSVATEIRLLLGGSD